MRTNADFCERVRKLHILNPIFVLSRCPVLLVARRPLCHTSDHWVHASADSLVLCCTAPFSQAIHGIQSVRILFKRLTSHTHRPSHIQLQQLPAAWQCASAIWGVAGLSFATPYNKHFTCLHRPCSMHRRSHQHMSCGSCGTANLTKQVMAQPPVCTLKLQLQHSYCGATP